MPRTRPEDLAPLLIGQPFETLHPRMQRVARHIAEHRHIARAPGHVDDTTPATRGQRAADAVASFGGSWAFVGLFAGVMLLWVGLNAVLLATRDGTFDPYPYILLNLFLSMLAAIQAPIILMAQNRQGERDRESAGNDYEVNLKAELEIMSLHDKIDQLREQQWDELLTFQREQMRLLSLLTPAGKSAPSNPDLARTPP